MSGSSQHLTLFEDRCDQCGACKAACPHGAIKVGAAFIYVDWRKCEGCLKCVESCNRKAIVSRVVPLRSSSAKSTVPLAEVNKVVVGSRAEAKAVRRAAERAAKGTKPANAAKPVKQAKTAAKAKGAKLAEPTPGIAAARPASGPGAPAKAPASKPAARALDSSGAAVAWTLVDVGAVLAIMLLALVAKNAVLALDQVALMPQLGKMVVRAVVLAAFYIAQIASFGWLAGRHGVAAAVAFGLRRVETDRSVERPSVLGSAGLVVALLIACEAFSITYRLAMQAAGIVQPERLSSDLAGIFGGGPVGLLVAFALVAIAAPFAEEIAFRGIVLPALGDRLGMWWGIGITSLLYAGFHASLWMIVPTGVLGIALGWLTWTRRSLWPAVALHVLYNATAVAAAFATSR